MELLQNGVTVVARFEHLTVKVPFNVELDLVRISSGLEEDVGKWESRGEKVWKDVVQTWMGREKVY